MTCCVRRVGGVGDDRVLVCVSCAVGRVLCGGAGTPVGVAAVSELYYDRGNTHEFLSVPLELSGPGELAGSQVGGLFFSGGGLVVVCPVLML